MTEYLGEMSPGLILILGALLVPFLSGPARAIWMLALPVVAFAHLLGFDHGAHGLVTVFDFNQSLVTDDFRTYHPGVEVSYAGQIAGRLGWYSDPLGEIDGLTFGIGFSWKSLNLDLGSIPQAKNSDLDNVNKITLGYRF